MVRLGERVPWLSASLLLSVLLSAPELSVQQGAITRSAPPHAGAVADFVPLQAGHANWTAKKLKKFLKKPKLDAVLVGFSAASCGAYCAQFEGIYRAFTDTLTAELPRVEFVRIDADAEKSAVRKYDVGALPAIVTFKKGRNVAIPYAGLHDVASMVNFARKLVGPAYRLGSCT